ncbi:MAG: exonuclease SbcCD subunit D [Methanosarcinaceae archaeon]|nr:exonuclease SbcCD subunit D [Methanosarcinaceae archaeon]
MSPEIKILHTADSHIGYRQYHSDVRRQDFLDAFSSVIGDAIEMKMDAVVHAGDLFDSRNPTLEDILDTMNILTKLKGAKIPFLSIVGNHESKQHTQWLDLFQNMGIAIRLGMVPYEIEEVAIYGIDSVAKSKIPLFDYSIFDSAGDEVQSMHEYKYNLLVMHQLMNPFAFGEWDSEEVIRSLPFEVHAMLLGDYHKYEKTKVGDCWVTYCGSTERNSAAERETRSYNIITLNDSGIDISRRNISTRDFEFIEVLLDNDAKAHETIFAAIKEHDVSGKVAFVDISGNTDIVVSFSEVEEFLLKQGALVPRIRDMRVGDEIADNALVSVSFSDPDEAVKEEIKKMDLTGAGLVIDEIVRDMRIGKSKLDNETEMRIGKLIESMDFKEPVSHIKRKVMSEAIVEGSIPELICEGTMEVYVSDSENADEGISEDEDGGEVEGEVEGEVVVKVDNEYADKGVAEEKAKYGTKKTTSVPKQYNLGDYL